MTAKKSNPLVMDVNVVDPKEMVSGAWLRVWLNDHPNTPHSTFAFSIATLDDTAYGFCRFADQAWQEFLATCDELGLDVDMRVPA